MKPSTLRYIRNEQDVWAFLWRLIPRAVKQVKDTNKQRKQTCQLLCNEDAGIYNDGVYH